jgi:hypothetical protein
MRVQSNDAERAARMLLYLSLTEHAQTRQLALYQPSQAFQERKCCDKHLLLFGSEVVGKGTSKSLFPLPSCAMDSLESCLCE